MNRVLEFADEKDLVKIITGMRRSGKSVLMKLIKESLLSRGIENDRIIDINFELLEFQHLNSAIKLNEYLVWKVTSTDLHYVFLDEVQFVDKFETAINSIRVSHNVSIFITGSNAKILSGELRTLLSGRYVKFYVAPFSFSEACEMLDAGKDDYDEILSNYLKWGGLPQRFSFNTFDQTQNYLFDVFDSIAARDVVERFKIQNIALFKSILQLILESTGNLFSIKNAEGYLASVGRKVSRETIYNYLEAVSSALLVTNCEKYNIAGKAIMSNTPKYYATDLGIMQIKASPNKINLGSQLETVVFKELKRRGYQVYVGYLDSAEIDFVTIKGDEFAYYQVSTYLEGNDDLQAREFGAFSHVKDNYTKNLISLDKSDISRDGIKHHNIIDWLLVK